MVQVIPGGVSDLRHEPAGRRSQTGGELTSLALSCARKMPGRGREVQAEWPRTLDADRASLKALL